MKKTFLLSLIVTTAMASAAMAAGDVKHPRQVDWSTNGAFGKVDKPAAQRGLQIYKEVCSACHGLKRVAFRSLTELGFSEAEVKALAVSYQIKDGPNDDGDMYDRPGRPSDYFPSPYANEQQARATHNGAYPPDLSLIVKARHDGKNYLYSLLTGYGQTPPEHKADGTPFVISDGQHYNPYFPGGVLAMVPPLSDGQVSYEDGTVASVDQMAKDVSSFLQWAAEPEMEQRKSMGIKVLIYLAVFTAFMYLAKRNLWRKLH